MVDNRPAPNSEAGNGDQEEGKRRFCRDQSGPRDHRFCGRRKWFIGRWRRGRRRRRAVPALGEDWAVRPHPMAPKHRAGKSRLRGGAHARRRQPGRHLDARLVGPRGDGPDVQAGCRQDADGRRAAGAAGYRLRQIAAQGRAWRTARHGSALACLSERHL